MNKAATVASQKLTLLRDVANKRIIKQFATKYDFVYFGPVDPRDDEHTLVRGLTVSTSHSDNHYTVGSFKGHDIILVQRRNTLKFPGRESTKYSWLIMQFDLKKANLPHVFIDCLHHDEIFFANLATSKPHLQDLTAYFSQSDPLFAQNCKIFAAASQYQEVASTLDAETTATIARHLKQFDYEIEDDRLLVYSSNALVSVNVLQDMMRVGMWLADVLNSKET